MENRFSTVARNDNEPVVIGPWLASSEAFRTLFRDGMALVEETSAYLDGQGREDSRHLQRVGTVAYASESMRLTTRLMQLASWLLLQRAVNDGEMSAEQASGERAKVHLGGLSSATEGAGWEELPQAFRDLIERSIHLQERVRRMDYAMHARPEGRNDNPVGQQIGQLARAFGG